jgi:hypothetical protein
MSKIKIRAASWHVFADSTQETPPYLGMIVRSAYQGHFEVFTGRNGPQSRPICATFAEAVDYIRTNAQAAA